jgi:hypothetical protein
MAVLRVDEVLVPGQVATLRRRLELLVPDHERLSAELKVLDELAAETSAGRDPKATADRATRQAAKIRLQLTAVTREMESLQSLVDARLNQAQKRK